jgi:hypothetical protein
MDMAAARWLLPLVLLLLSACSSPRLVPSRGPDPQLITEEEVVASLATTAYELIRSLRPNFLSYRGETSFDRRTSRPYPNVYVDDQVFGTISILQSIPASDISSVRLYRSAEAVTKYGTGNAGGVIAISTRR